MAPTANRGLKLPDDRHLAFAVCIVESTPKGMTIEEYIGLLRQHVAKGRRENALSAVHRHLDRSSYWRAEYERVKEALDAAETDRIYLKLELDRLKASKEAILDKNRPKKRKKADDSDVIPVPRSPKRAKQASSEQMGASTPANVDVGFTIENLGEHGDILMRSFYQVHALLKSRDKTDAVALTQHLVRAADAVRTILQQAAKPPSSDDTARVNLVKEIVTAANRAMQSLVVGYARLTNVANSAEVQGHIVYAYVQTLETTMRTMTELTRLEVENSEQEAAIANQRPSTSKGKAKQKADATVRQRRNPIMSTFASFIAANIALLDAKNESHKPLFEGVAFVLIEKLATCLYTLVFGQARGASIEDEIAAFAQPDEIEDVDQPQTKSDGQLGVRVAKAEAPYLIQLLTRLMQVAPAHFGCSVGAKGGRSKGTGKQPLSKDNLAITAKERLQRTLVSCMFGEEGVDEDDDSFFDCLKKPVVSGSLPAMPAVKEADVREWFEEEVWRLLGWDLLSRAGAW